jgi:cephalosporin hydroxylase
MRSFKTAFDPTFLREYHRGVMNFQYRGIPCLKSPIDLAIYSRVIWDVRPGTIIEIGSNRGGGALWLADTASSYALPTRVISIDLEPPSLADPRIDFVKGDAAELRSVLTEDALSAFGRPLLVIDDSAHTYSVTHSVLTFFASHLRRGDFLIIEDGVLTDLGWTDLYDGGPNRAIGQFIAADGHFEVAEEYCNMFGQNATYNPNGYLRVL